MAATGLLFVHKCNCSLDTRNLVFFLVSFLVSLSTDRVPFVCPCLYFCFIFFQILVLLQRCFADSGGGICKWLGLMTSVRIRSRGSQSWVGMQPLGIRLPAPCRHEAGMSVVPAVLLLAHRHRTLTRKTHVPSRAFWHQDDFHSSMETKSRHPPPLYIVAPPQSKYPLISLAALLSSAPGADRWGLTYIVFYLCIT